MKSENKTLQDLLSADGMREIDKWIAKFPVEQRQSAVMTALMVAQEENGGWLTNELMDAVADYLQMPNIAVYEVATFYSMYDKTPVGRHKINVCTNISCKLRQSHTVIEHLQARLGIEVGHTTEDGKFTLREVECLGACAGAPMMQIDKEYYENLDAKKIDEILKQFDV